ncbi:MAG: hypothetical protein ABFS12_06150 [Bacteroidota bacterium]
MEKLIFQIEKKTDSISEDEVKRYLDILERQIDIEHIRSVEEKQLNVFNFEKVDRLPIIISTRDDVAHKTSNAIDWPGFPFGQMWNDYGAMLLNELRPVYESIKLKDDKVFSLRPNLSQIFVPSLFGVDASYPDDQLDSMPAVKSQLTFQHLKEINVNEIDFKKHWIIKKYCNIVDTWKELLSDFPKLKEVVHFSLPDLQGPFNLYFLLRGTEAYTDVILESDFTHDLMQKITSILIDVTNYLSDFIEYNGISYYWNYSYPGKIRNVDDNSIQISSDLYNEFVLPYNQMLAQQCSGGIHHYCGQGDHIIDQVLNIEGNVGLNFGNPEMQNWETIYEKAQKYKVVLLYDRVIPIEKFKELDRGVIMKIIVSSLEEGKRILENHYK